MNQSKPIISAIFMSCLDFAKYIPLRPENTIAISISDDLKDPTCSPNPPDGVNYLDFQRFEFYDFEHEDCISDADVNRIIDLVEEHLYTRMEEGQLPRQFVVHCYAGVSRSAAVCKFIHELGGSEAMDHYSLFNKVVYQKLRAEFQRRRGEE